jgi:hypothetical protein
MRTTSTRLLQLQLDIGEPDLKSVNALLDVSLKGVYAAA